LDKNSPFYVSPQLHRLAGWVHDYRGFWLALGRLEARVLANELDALSITQPIFVCGLARSGSTLLHEILAAQPGVATHRIKDYPLVYTPYWWRQALRRQTTTAPRERAHGDRVLVTPDSPEALEEMVWMAFFPRCHDPAVSNVLGADVRQPAFETFYQAHLRKLLLAERAGRYVAKANYHTARLPYLLRLFPDARILLPVREPVSHIGSLLRQQQRFAEGERQHPRALAYMQRSGHFEFGLDRRPINLGDTGRVRAVESAWQSGEEVRGWALYWALVRDYLADLLATNERVRRATLVVRYEAMCDTPVEVVQAVLSHCALPGAEQFAQQFAPRVRRPDYYQSPVAAADVAVIHRETVQAAKRWGYS
jgi:hypothetical protein